MRRLRPPPSSEVGLGELPGVPEGENGKAEEKDRRFIRAASRSTEATQEEKPRRNEYRVEGKTLKLWTASNSRDRKQDKGQQLKEGGTENGRTK